MNLTAAPVALAYDVSLIALDPAFWTFAAGIFTCQQNHRAEFYSQASWTVTGVSAIVVAEILLLPATVLQRQRQGAYSTTSVRGDTCVCRTRDFVVGEQVQLLFYTEANTAQTIASEAKMMIRRG